MKKGIYLFVLLLFISSSLSLSQEKDEYGNYNIKKLSQQDMERIFGDIYKPGKIFKTAGDPRAIKEVIISGNKITTVVFNYGSICKGNYLGNVADLVWKGLGNGFEFGPLVAAAVPIPNANGGYDTTIIVDDSFILPGQGSYSPDGTLKWGWLPKSDYADPNQTEIARLNAPDKNFDGKPDSWPERWYSPGAGKYVWPAFLGDQATAPDEEVYYVDDDFTNQAYIKGPAYYPFINDSTKRGLGLDMEVRILQFNNPLAENIIFLVFQITNVSDKDLPKVYFGMHGDPHVGGPADYGDDRAAFIPPSGPLAEGFAQRARSMVYAFDEDMTGSGGRTAGFFGWKFLESPTNSTDGKDNDDDGITDESPFNSAGNYIDGVSIPLSYGISDVAKYTAIFGAPKPRFQGDEDGDWDAAAHDIGIDGIGPDSPNYPGPDYGEGDGIPSQAWYFDTDGNNKYDVGEPISDERLPGYRWAGSEPNFGMRDISESDQIGLTSFHAATYTNSLPNVPKNASLMWEWLSSDSIDANQELLSIAGDNVFNFGSGPLSLKRGESQRFSMAILFGNDLNDLVLNAETSTRVLEADYRFAQPPIKPIVKVVPGDKRVTLYWDTRAEASVDPLTVKKDFQGYKIYRSTDPTFADVYKITDGNGNPFLGVPLFDSYARKKAQFDLVDSLSGFFPVEYQGRAVKYYVGDNTGLVHEYVDSTVQNGITYYYAVVSYDGGSLEVGKELPPSECQAVIQKDAITGKLSFDVNTGEATPNPISTGIKMPEAGLAGVPTAVAGNSTGKLYVKILDPLAVDERLYKISFRNNTTYSLLDSTGITETFSSKDTVFVSLSQQNIDENSFELLDANNNVVAKSNYFINISSGKVRGSSPGSLPANQTFTVKYRYYPIVSSTNINYEDNNPSFNGLKLYIQTDSLDLNRAESKFTNSQIQAVVTLHSPPLVGNPKIKYRADWEIRWNNLDTTATGTYVNPGDTVKSDAGKTVVCPFTVWNLSENRKGTFLIKEGNPKTRNNLRWDWGESVVVRPTNATGSTTSYEVVFALPDSSVTTTPILPKAGDVFTIKTTKPFQANDTYLFQTKPTVFSQASAKERIDDIYVVPNPYVGYSMLESPGRLPDLRSEKQVQFRNLPPKCTIRIYTMVGELVQTIEKDDYTSYASWDLLSYEGQRIAYGVYIFHVDIPGVGEKIGRLAVIK
ncbi:MAG: hypothetical protein M0P61_09310 [Ignavibacteriaceae bacterium]|jgi:hypothetical protein|nr:hypothetical protein [Ignavibacteriaceae bacterium]